MQAHSPRDEDPSAGQIVNDTLAEIMPWLSSAVFHLSLMVLAIFVVWMTAQLDVPDDPIIAVRPRVHDPHRQPLDPSDNLIDDLNPSEIRRTVPTETSDDNQWEKLIGVTGGFKPTTVLPIIHEPGSLEPLVLSISTGSTTIFDPPVGTTFNSVVYVIDASGSLVADMGLVIDELRRSIQQLDPDQKFTVIFFQRDLAIEAPPRGMKSATAAMKKQILDWVTPSQGNLVPGGASNPVAALTVALRYRPQVLFLLSDNITGRGRYEMNQQVLLDELARLNADHRTQVHTIQFLYPDPLGTLKRIADQHGGTHRFVRETDLILRSRLKHGSPG